MKRSIILLGICICVCALALRRTSIVKIVVKPGEKPPIAVPDFRGAGDAQGS